MACNASLVDKPPRRTAQITPRKDDVAQWPPAIGIMFEITLSLATYTNDLVLLSQDAAAGSSDAA